MKRKNPDERPKDTSAPRGRPSRYTPEIAKIILDRLAAGETLRSICRDEGMPAESTVRLWYRSDEPAGFATQYARARDAGLDTMAEEILAIADDNSQDTVTRKREDGSEYEAVDHEHINRSRLRVDTRKWILSKLAPKRYGDRLELEHSVSERLAEAIIRGRDRARAITGESCLKS